MKPLVRGLGFETPVRGREEWDNEIVQDNKTMLYLAQNYLLKQVIVLGTLTLLQLNLIVQ